MSGVGHEERPTALPLKVGAVGLAGVPLDPRGREVADLEDTVMGWFGGWLRVRRHTSL